MAKRAQLSVETMIMYGLILLVALSVVGVLLYFNVIDLGSYLPDTCDIGGSGDLKCEEMQYTGNATIGNIRIGIRNIGQKPVSLLDVSVEDVGGIHFNGAMEATATYNSGNIDGTVTAQSLPPGEIATVNINVGKAIPGQVFRGILKTTYKFKEGALEQTATGSMRTKATEP